MNLSPYDLAIIAGLFTIVGALIGVISSYWLSIHLFEKQQLLIATANFRAAFSNTIGKMAIAQNDSSIDKRDLLSSTFHELASAVETYRPFISSKDSTAYQDAWQKYYMPDGKVSFTNYYLSIEDQGIKRDCYALFTERINAILYFAKL
jgi:hypothetical protein